MKQHLADKAVTVEPDRARRGTGPALSETQPGATRHPILQLQGTIGNQAVNRLLQSGTFQTKLMVSRPGDTRVQRQESDEEERLQGKFPQEKVPMVQRNRPDDALQRNPGAPAAPPARHPNRTGLPDHLKFGIESLSGLSMDNVNVHYNSSQPAGLNALAYTQGTDIHVAPGQEQHLPHEAWHVVQQTQGRVQPTMQLTGGVLANDDQGLEHEADVMGAKAAVVGMAQENSMKADTINSTINTAQCCNAPSSAPVQRAVGFEFEIGAVSTTKLTPRFGRSARRDKLPKKDVLVNGTGYNVEADEETAQDPNYGNTSYSGYSDLEFVTDAFPVSITGFTQLTQALTDIAALITHIHSHPNTDIPADMLPRGSATANRYLRFNGGLLAGKPQATVGLSLAALGTLFQDIATNPGGGAAAPTAAQELFGGGLDPSGFGTSVGGTAATTGLARVGAARAAAHAEIVASLPHSEQSVEMEALMAHLILYLDQGEQGVAGYGKTIAGGLMMRTAFDTVYQQIPPVGRVTTDKHPDLFALMVCRAARRVNANINDDGDVFSGGIYNDNLKYGPASAEPKTSAQRAALTGHLRRRDWLEGIASGVDKLTRVNFPSQRLRHTSEIESLGSYGVTTDTMGAIHLPILEFRGLPQIQAGIFPLMAMDIFRYVFALNTAAGTGNPGDLQAVGINSRTALLNPSDPNYALELANAVTAAAHAVAGWRGTTGG